MNDEIKVPTMQVPPIKRVCMTIGQLPASYVETMSYYEMLVWFVNYLRDDIIPVVNANGLATKELQELFVELQSYVNTYFDNLDIQEEVNNKLDEMAESGQLTDIIAQYLGLAGMITFNTVAEMKAATNLVNGSKCATLGYRTVNDGGNAFYKVRTVTNEDVIEEGRLIALNDELLVAELVYGDTVNPIQFGCYGDGTHDDTTNFQKCVNVEQPISLLSKTYLISDTIDLYNGIKMVGNGTTKTTIKNEINDGTAIFKLDDSIAHFIIKDFHIDGQNNNAIGFEIDNPYDDCVLENLDIRQLNNYYIKCGNSSTISQSLVINNCMLYGPENTPTHSMIYMEKCYETNFTNNKLLYLQSYPTTAATYPNLFLHNTYDFHATGNSFANSVLAVKLTGESDYCRFIGNTYEIITGSYLMDFECDVYDNSKYNIIIETQYYNAPSTIKFTNSVGNIIIGGNYEGGRRNFALNTKTVQTSVSSSGHIYGDGKYLVQSGIGFRDYQNNLRFKIECLDSQYADNGIQITDAKNNGQLYLRPKAFVSTTNGYRFCVKSPDGSITKYIGIDNTGALTLYDNTV